MEITNKQLEQIVLKSKLDLLEEIADLASKIYININQLGLNNRFTGNFL